jgi:excisionase family DNA binding protein
MSNEGGNGMGMLSEKQAAERLGISRITLLRARKAGRIGYFKIGSRVVYSERHLTDFLASVEQKALTQEGFAA